MYLLDSVAPNLNGKKIAVMGWGKLVGKPIAAILAFRGLTPEIVRSKTERKEEILKEADVVIAGMGKGKYIKGNMIKEGAIIIDAGTSESNSGIVGDVDLESITGVASFVSPVPGGVGPMTVAMLFRNVLKVAQTIEN
jgi:methylenetetrahydrofolate dehydrogenase (NADP+)/methenyltetrahydrofolate cyclohydrolase